MRYKSNQEDLKRDTGSIKKLLKMANFARQMRPDLYKNVLSKLLNPRRQTMMRRYKEYKGLKKVRKPIFETI
jgi:hypothetical protein